jgi:hypothetical protein
MATKSRHARATVSDANHGSHAIFPRLDLDTPARFGVLEGIVEDIRHYLLQAGGVTFYPGRRSLMRHRVLRRPIRIGKGLHATFDELAEIHGFALYR